MGPQPALLPRRGPRPSPHVPWALGHSRPPPSPWPRQDFVRFPVSTWNFRPPLRINAGCEPVWKSLLLLSWGSELLSEHKVIRFQMPLANWKPPSAPLLHEENPGLYATLREAGWVSKTPFPLKSKGEGFAPLCSREAVTPCASRRRLLPSSLPPPPTPCPCRPSCREAYLGGAPACARACARACVSRWVGAWSPHYTAAMLHFWLLIVQSPSPWRREQLLHSGPWLGCAGWPARLSARPSACPAVGAASSSASRCPRALPGRAQESVFTNTIRTAPWLPRLCPGDVRPRAPGGGPGARPSAAQGTLSLARCSLARQQPGEGLQPRGAAAGTGGVQRPRRGPLRGFPCPS